MASLVCKKHVICALLNAVGILSLPHAQAASTNNNSDLLEHYQQQGIVDIGGQLGASVAAMTPSGQFAVGGMTLSQGSQAFLWRAAQGISLLPVPHALQGGSSRASAISNDGQYIVGFINYNPSSTSGSVNHAVMWSGLHQVSVLPSLNPQLTSSTANAISGDGAIIAGASTTADATLHAVYWDRETSTIHDLGALNTAVGQDFSNALALNQDGSIIVGVTNTADSTFRAFRWTKNTGMVALPSLGGASQANGISNTGRIIGDSINGSGEKRAVYWDNSTVHDLGTLKPDQSGQSQAKAITPNGALIVGVANTTQGSTGFIWKDGAGMFSVADWLKHAHVQAEGMPVRSVNAISADGTTIAGQLMDGDGYVAHLIALKAPAAVNPAHPETGPVKPQPPYPEHPNDHQPLKPDYHANGIVNTHQVISSLYFVQRNLEVQRQLLDVAASQADCASFGADGMCVKAQADLRFRGGEVQYRVPAASLTVAYQFYPQWRLGLSAMAADMHIKDANGGRITQQAPAFTLFTGYGNAGEAGWKAYAGVTLLDAGMDIERAYHNGDAREIGYGHTRTRAYDFNLSGGYTFTPYTHVQLTPYLALSYHDLRWNGYDEVDTSVFTAHFDGLRSKVTSAALGVATQWQVSARTSLGLDISVEKNIKQHNSRAVASVLGGFAGLASQYQVPDVDDVMPHVEASYTFAADKHQAVSLSAGYQDIGFGSGEGNVGLSYRVAF
ncbi:autotransporter domain-containing protein [Plesiomonas shigelloides]|uniref:autotransporter domain-containing protein n=1 Tax=Plesiomonas shigelloides TaxID=703 RepID=UPI003EB9CDC9